MNNETAERLKELIVENKIKEVIESLIKEDSITPSDKNAIMLIAAKYRNWENSVLNGIVEYSVFPAKIVFSLLNFIDHLEFESEMIQHRYTHDLHQFPRSPLVESRMVRMALKKEIARVVPENEALNYIDEINAFREEADPEDETVTYIGKEKLPNIGLVGSEVFWSRTIQEACLHGPRMLAALLLTIPDQYFSAEPSLLRRELLLNLKP